MAICEVELVSRTEIDDGLYPKARAWSNEIEPLFDPTNPLDNNEDSFRYLIFNGQLPRGRPRLNYPALLPSKQLIIMIVVTAKCLFRY